MLGNVLNAQCSFESRLLFELYSNMIQLELRMDNNNASDADEGPYSLAVTFGGHCLNNKRANRKRIIINETIFRNNNHLTITSVTIKRMK